MLNRYYVNFVISQSSTMTNTTLEKSVRRVVIPTGVMLYKHVLDNWEFTTKVMSVTAIPLV